MYSDESPSDSDEEGYESPNAEDVIAEGSEDEDKIEEFRYMPTRPYPEDIINSEPVELRENSNHAYKNLQFYLDTQFRLLREDMVGPMREAVETYRNQLESTDENEPSEENNLFVFKDVKLSAMQIDPRTGWTCRLATFEKPDVEPHEWVGKLKYFQCVCLSSDEFQEEALIAVVLEKPDDEKEFIEERTVTMHIYKDCGRDKSLRYVMIEPNSYFLSYHYVLKALQNLTELPLGRYLVEGNRDILLPAYMRPSSSSSVKHNLEKISIEGCEYEVAKLFEEFRNPRFDESQRSALCSALTRELAIIQGPPGTGKTFIGVQIIRGLLENRERWGINSPILIVCYTNHALDQFMERIVEAIDEDVESGLIRHSGPRAIRFGNRGNSQILEAGGILKKDALQTHRRHIPRRMATTNAEKEKLTAEYRLRDSLAAMMQAPLTVLSPYILFAEDRDYQNEAIKRRMNYIWKQFTSFSLSGPPEVRMDIGFACWLLGLPSSKFEAGEESAPMTQDAPDIHQRRRKLLDHSKKGTLFDVENRWKWTDLILPRPGVTLFASPKRYGMSRRQQNQTQSFDFDPELVKAVNNIFDHIIQTPEMTEKEECSVRDIRGLERTKRWALYMRWLNRVVLYLRQNLKSAKKAFEEALEKYNTQREIHEAQLYSNALVIGATTTRIAMFRKHMAPLTPKIIVIEEAAEVLEGHIIASFLPSIEHAILIGDQQQLRPKPCVHDLAVHYHLDISMFERLVSRGLPFTTLLQQHRMLPELTQTIVKPFFYAKLEDSPNVGSYPRVNGLKRNLFFFCHSEEQDTPAQVTSHKNHFEAHMAVSLTHYILQQRQYGPEQITILATYSAQTNLIRQLVKADFGEDQPSPFVETVDGYQGKENDVVILSLVRSKSRFHRGIGFLNVKNRITVALTRARHGFFLIGNGLYLAEHSTLWCEIEKSLKPDHIGFKIPVVCANHGEEQTVSSPVDFETLCRDGGCRIPCEGRMKCGHVCPLNCHPQPDFLHESIPCEERIIKSFPCGHVADIACYKADVATCTEKCVRLLTCGHRCELACGQECPEKCKLCGGRKEVEDEENVETKVVQRRLDGPYKEEEFSDPS